MGEKQRSTYGAVALKNELGVVVRESLDALVFCFLGIARGHGKE